MKTPSAYSYLRFSNPTQATGDSLRRQTDLRDAWLTRNGVKLDASLTLEDKGISGFTGEHRTNPDRHALAAFLYAVEKKRIPRGSYLIVESLDRLSREDILPALTLVLNLIQSGVRIVQLLPVEMVYDDKANPMHLMMMIMELSRGHSESAMKAERLGQAWQEKKRLAAESGKPLTARTPAWLSLVDGEWRVNEKAADAVRRVYKLATAGYGIGAITKKLNADRVPTIARATNWGGSYVAKLLGNRAVFGECQPHTRRGGKRRPDGKAIPNYFPAIVSEQEFFAARAAMADRRSRPGRPAADRVNLFAGLLFDARDGGPMQMMNKGKKGGGTILVSAKARKGMEGAKMASFPLATFEAAILACLREIDPREILPHEDGNENDVLALMGRVGDVEAREDELKAKLRDPKYKGVDALTEVLADLANEKKRLVEELAVANQQAASPLATAWGTCQSLLAALESAPNQEDARTRLRATMRRVVSGIWMLVVPRGRKRLAAVRVQFVGEQRRDYFVLHRPAHGGAFAPTEMAWHCRSLADVAALGELDLRNPVHVAKLEKALSALDVSAVRESD